MQGGCWRQTKGAAGAHARTQGDPADSPCSWSRGALSPAELDAGAGLWHALSCVPAPVGFVAAGTQPGYRSAPANPSPSPSLLQNPPTAAGSSELPELPALVERPPALGYPLLQSFTAHWGPASTRGPLLAPADSARSSHPARRHPAWSIGQSHSAGKAPGTSHVQGHGRVRCGAESHSLD